MTRNAVRAVPLVFVLLASSCIGGSPKGGADELRAIANKVTTATYAAVYRFAFTRQFAPGITTRMEITQIPPTTVRKIDTTTKPAEGKAITLTTWYIHNAKGDYVCNDYPSVGTKCQKNPIARSSFGSEKLDIYFDTPREADSFATVRKASQRERIHGELATCFEAVPTSASPEPVSPAPTEERFRYNLCYADDGILLRGQRTTLDDSATSANAESFVEALSVSRVVEPRELRLPGPVVSPSDLP